ncbi:MAG: SAP domain-containing protein [Euryarchaeota archaeon]|nr:SAP domain-containing protein [Euryarchaeota archaeon]
MAYIRVKKDCDSASATIKPSVSYIKMDYVGPIFISSFFLDFFVADLNSLTVVELKQLLKEQDLPVSGNKSVLISRLEENDSEFYLFDEVENEDSSPIKTDVDCPFCDSLLRYPSDYLGDLSCPSCGKIFNPTIGQNQSQLSKDEQLPSSTFSINLGYVGLGIGLLAIFLFLTASNLTNEWDCSDTAYRDFDGDGVEEEYELCSSEYTIFDAPSTRIRLFSCFILVPLGIVLSLIGREQAASNFVAGGVATNNIEWENGKPIIASGVSVAPSVPNNKVRSVDSIIANIGAGLGIALLVLGVLAVIGVIILIFIALGALSG